MPTWSVILNESQKAQEQAGNNPLAGIDYIVKLKKDFLKRLSEKTGRNTILYFSSFLQKQPSNDASINDFRWLLCKECKYACTCAGAVIR